MHITAWEPRILSNVLSAPVQIQGQLFKAQHLMHRPKAQSSEQRSPGAMGSCEPLSNKQEHAFSRCKTSSHTSFWVWAPPDPLYPHPPTGLCLTNDTFNDPAHHSEVRVAEQHCSNYPGSFQRTYATLFLRVRDLFQVGNIFKIIEYNH